MSWIQPSARSAARALVLSFLLLASPASAIPVTVYADGNADSGFDPNDVAAAISMGAAEPIEVSGLIGGEGLFSITTPEGIPGRHGRSKERPSRGRSTWTLEISSDFPADMLSLLENLSVVILGHDPNDPLGYKTENVGLEIDTELPWQFVSPEGAREIYIAVRLDSLCSGEQLEPGGSCPIPIEYRVGQRLKQVNDEYVFPRYAVAYLSPSVPEPSVLALLLGAAAVGFAVGRPR